MFPLRFFSSVEEARAAAELVKSKIWVSVNKMPNDLELTKLLSENPHRPQPMDHGTFESFTDTNWPFSGEENSDQQFQVDLDILGGRSRIRIAFISAFALPLFIIWYFLPVWLLLIGIGFLRFVQSGGQFVFASTFEALLICVPLIAITTFLLYRAARALLGLHHVGQQKLSCSMRPQGAHISHDAIKSWFRWECVSELLLEDKSAGWIFADTGIEARYPKQCFDDEGKFEEFKSALIKYSGARHANESPAIEHT